MAKKPSMKKKDIQARARQIMELANSNMRQEEIAEIVGISQPQVSRVIDREMQKHIGIEVSTYRAQRLMKLEALEQTWYPKARKGDSKANQQWLDIDKRIREYVPGAELPKQVDMNVSADERTEKALALLEEIKKRTGIPTDEQVD